MRCENYRTFALSLWLLLPIGAVWAQLDDDGIPPGADVSVLDETSSAATVEAPSMEAGPGAAPTAEFTDFDSPPVEYLPGGCMPCEPCCAGPSGYFWVRAEYLLWWTKGMDVPPLASTGSTGALGAPDTTVLYGGEPILKTALSGFRIGMGTWLDCSRRWGLEGDYWQLGEESEHFFRESNANGTPSIYRPYFDLTPRDPNTGALLAPREAAEVVSEPGRAFGFIEVDSTTELYGAGIRLRKNLACGSGAVPFGDICGPQYLIPSHSRIDALFGYRYLSLRDSLSIHERVNSLLTNQPGTFDIVDGFGTSNDFHGADVGILWEASQGRWSMELLGKLALGTVREKVSIDGRTVITGSQAQDGTYSGGLLTQDSNIGVYRRNEFAVVPQLGLTIGYRLTPRLRTTLGYSFLYWSRVVRPGDQIDREVATDQLPPPDPTFAGPFRPAFQFVATDYWAQGINVGLEYTW